MLDSLAFKMLKSFKKKLKSTIEHPDNVKHVKRLCVFQGKACLSTDIRYANFCFFHIFGSSSTFVCVLFADGFAFFLTAGSFRVSLVIGLG